MKKNFLLITGGTGGHVIPAKNFANFLNSNKINCTIITDNRGFKYINNYSKKIHVVSSSNLNGNLVFKLLGIFRILFGFIQSFYIIYFLKPSHVLSFGSYASFSPMLSCIILKSIFKIDLFIHEQNSLIGRTNNFFLNYIKKLFLNFDIKNRINSKFNEKTFVVGSPENIYSPVINKEKINTLNEFTIFISGGSQGSEYIAKLSIDLIKIIDNENKIKAKFIFQCPKKIIKKARFELKNIKSRIIISEFFTNIDEILSNVNLSISRSGAGTIVDLINFKIPSILIPLPNSKDNHQYYNALILAQHNLAIIIDQNNDDIDFVKKNIYENYNNLNKLKLINETFDKIKVKNSNSLIYKLILNEK